MGLQLYYLLINNLHLKNLYLKTVQFYEIFHCFRSCTSMQFLY